jgi:hypothetical protein
MGNVARMFFPKVPRGAPLSQYLPQSPVRALPRRIAPRTPCNVTITRERS